MLTSIHLTHNDVTNIKCKYKVFDLFHIR